MDVAFYLVFTIAAAVVEFLVIVILRHPAARTGPWPFLYPARGSTRLMFTTVAVLIPAVVAIGWFTVIRDAWLS